MFLHLFTSGVLYFCISLFYSILEELLIFCISVFLLFWRTDTDVTWGIPRGLNPSFQDTYHHNDGQWKGSKRHKNSYGHIIGVRQKTFQVLIFGIETSRFLSQIEGGILSLVFCRYAKNNPSLSAVGFALSLDHLLVSNNELKINTKEKERLNLKDRLPPRGWGWQICYSWRHSITIYLCLCVIV